MKIGNSKRVLRIWIEATIVGVCVALTAVILQSTVGSETWLIRLLLLIGAALALCLIQYLVSLWVRSRVAVEQAADAPASEQPERRS